MISTFFIGYILGEGYAFKIYKIQSIDLSNQNCSIQYWYKSAVCHSFWISICVEVKADCSFAIHGKGFGGEKPMESGYPSFSHHHSLIQGAFFTGPSLKSSRYRKVSLG